MSRYFPAMKAVRILLLAGCCQCGLQLHAQKPESRIALRKEKGENRISVWVGQRLLTSFFYPDTLEKPVLYPVCAPDGQTVTRGFPLNPLPGDPVDHPHHIGSWFNYESVNGLDFWNNSFAIAKEKKPHYGWIKTDSILQMKSGTPAQLVYAARWTDINQNVLLRERTALTFHARGNEWIIDRTTVLTAMQEVTFADVKDGLMAIRIARELQLPAHDTDHISTGNYLTSDGVQGNDVWGSRAAWCLLYGKKGMDSISIALIDHPQNPGFPTRWHARGYGLFAANPLADKAFDKKATAKSLQVKKGDSVTFRFRLVIASGKNRISNTGMQQLAKEFEKQK